MMINTLNITDTALAPINGGTQSDLLTATFYISNLNSTFTITLDPTSVPDSSSNTTDIIYIHRGTDDTVTFTNPSGWDQIKIITPFYNEGNYYQEYRIPGAILRIQNPLPIIEPIPAANGNLLNGTLGSNDILTGTSERDRINGRDGNDIIIGKGDADILYGGSQADTFVYETASDSLLNTTDRLVDFKQPEGDRLQYQPATITGLFNAGAITGANLSSAVTAAYADKNQLIANQTLGLDEGVFFQYNQRTYLSINSGTSSYEANNDLLIDISTIGYKSGDNLLGNLTVSDYFLI